MRQVKIRAVVFCVTPAIVGAASAATPGIVETFQSGLNVWGSNPSLVTHQPAGGADGPLDGFASVEDFGAATELLIRTSFTDGTDFTGDYTAAGITHVSFDVNELSIDDNLSIRFGFGSLGNFWVSNQIIDPQANTWESVTIELNPFLFTEVFGAGGTWAAAMGNVQRFQIRNDFGIAGIMPDPAQGDFGVDNIRLIPTPGPAALLAAAGIATLRRRRS